MAQFRGTIQGRRGDTSRFGSKASEVDTFDVYATNGSGSGRDTFLGTVKLVDGVPSLNSGG